MLKLDTLDIASIVEAALILMDDIGVDALSTRRLAKELGVKGPALYWHLRNKDELLAHMCEALFVRSLEASEGNSWQSWLRSTSINLRRTLNSVRDGARLVAYAEWTTKAKTELVAKLEGPLITSGVSKLEASKIVGVVNAYTIGWVVTESKAGHRSFLASRFDIDAFFLSGLDGVIGSVAGYFKEDSPVVTSEQH